MPVTIHLAQISDVFVGYTREVVRILHHESDEFVFEIITVQIRQSRGMPEFVHEDRREIAETRGAVSRSVIQSAIVSPHVAKMYPSA